jgi:hypothetical protein
MAHFKRGVSFPEIFPSKVGIVKKFFQKKIALLQKDLSITGVTFQENVFQK